MEPDRPYRAMETIQVEVKKGQDCYNGNRRGKKATNARNSAEGKLRGLGDSWPMEGEGDE